MKCLTTYDIALKVASMSECCEFKFVLNFMWIILFDLHNNLIKILEEIK